MDYILNHSTKGKNISQILKNENKTTTDKLNKIEESLKIEEKQIISKKNLLNNDQFRKLIQEFQIKIDNFNSEKKIAINLLNKKKINLTKDFINQINPIFIEFAEKNSISIILKKKDIIMGDSSLDKTLELLNLVNEKINDK
jgi:Skp family chaperone for outer membrane proteins